MNKTVSIYFVFVSLFIFLSCGGSSHRDRDEFKFLGRWENVFNYIPIDYEKSCFVDEMSGQSFVTEMTINQVGENEFELIELEGTFTGGTVNNEGTLTFLDIISGDLFADGSFCEYIHRYSYIPNTDSKLDTLRSTSIKCNDGYSCSDEAIGVAVRK